MADKIKVFTLIDDDGDGVTSENFNVITAWIAGDLEAAFVDDTYKYRIKVREMTREEYNNIPELD